MWYMLRLKTGLLKKRPNSCSLARFEAHKVTINEFTQEEKPM